MPTKTKSVAMSYIFSKSCDWLAPEQMKYMEADLREDAVAYHFVALRQANVINDFWVGLGSDDIIFTFIPNGTLPEYVERGLREIYRGRKMER